MDITEIYAIMFKEQRLPSYSDLGLTLVLTPVV